MRLVALLPILIVCTWVLFMRPAVEWEGRKALFAKWMTRFSVFYVVFLFCGAIFMESWPDIYKEETVTTIAGDSYTESSAGGGSYKVFAHDGQVVVVRETFMRVKRPWMGYLFPVNGSGQLVDRKITIEDPENNNDTKK